MPKFLPIVFLVAALALPGVVESQGSFDLEREQQRLWEFFADRHAEIGEAYKTAGIFEDARAHFDYAVVLVPEHRRAMRGLGFKQVRGKWVEDDPMPEKSDLSAEELQAARSRPDTIKERAYARNLERARRQVDAATRAEDTRAARILAHEVLFYAPDDEAAHSLRGHVKDGDDWVPGFFKPWRDSGRDHLKQATEGEETEGEDEQAKEIGATFARRHSAHLAVRTTLPDERAREMHRNAEAVVNRAMELLNREGPPFGRFTFTLTHLRTTSEYNAMLEKVLKLEGTPLEFARRMAGHSQREPWGYISRVNREAADDMFGNTVAIRVMQQGREGSEGSQPWVTTGFSYLVTTHVLGTCMTTRYRLIEAGHTGTTHELLPEFTKKIGTPEHLRQSILREVIHKRDIALARLVNVETNDMVLEYAAKSFSLMEYFFAERTEEVRSWLKAAPAERGKRIELLEKHFEMSADELESAWREWVLANY